VGVPRVNRFYRMKIYNGYRNATDLKDPIVAIGIFDGLHVGHKRVINRMLRVRDAGRDRVILTFDPHPRSVLHPGKPHPRIMSLEHRLLIFRKMGVDAAVVLHFSEHIAGMSPEDFIRRVIAGIGARTVYVGGNFHFGRGKSGDIDTLKKIGSLYGVDVRKVMPVRKRGRVVSSTWVRGLVSGGRIKEAEKLLRRPVSILGTVVRGDERGTTLGIPTANIDPHQEVIPPPGVYAVKIDIEDDLYDGVLNIGFKPTFYGRSFRKREEPRIEVHVFGFSGHLYGLAIEIFFIKRLRREKRFRNAEALVRQISADKASARKLLESPRILSRIRKYKYL